MTFDDDPGGINLDQKLAQLRAEFGEDIAVYDFGDDGMDTLDDMGNLGGALEEDMNDFNDETFGMDTVGKDFDFSGSTAQFLGNSKVPPPKMESTSTWPSMPKLLSTNDSRLPNESERARSSGINFTHDPLLASDINPSRRVPSSSQAKPSSSAPQGVKVRSLEEIEAEMRANAASSKANQMSSTAPRALTLEEVEAEMLRNARVQSSATNDEMRIQAPMSLPAPSKSRAQLVQQVQMQHFAAAQRHGTSSPVPSLAAMNIAQLRSNHASPVHLPALSHPAHPSHPQHPEWLRLQHQQQQMYTTVMLQQAQLQQLQAQAVMGSRTHSPISHGHSHSLSLHALPSVPMQSTGSVPMQSTGSVPINSLFQTENSNTGSPTAIDDLRSAAEARIQEHERQEVLRRKKAAKIAEMARYNNLMSQGDKDFITRIQVSQLVNPSHGQAGFDPYADDFYFHVYSAIRASRLVAQQQMQAAAAERASVTGFQGGREQDLMQNRNNRMNERKLTRRDHAMMRMAQNVQRIVDHAKERPKMSQLSLEGALGKIALRTRSAPRQMLQVQPPATSDDLAVAAGGENHPGTLTSELPKQASTVPGQPAMNRRHVLMALERLYSTVLEAEQLRRTQPPPLSANDAPDSIKDEIEQWETEYAAKKDKIWKQLRVLDPLGISHPHPFVSFISIAKGKRLLPRIIRLFTREQALQVLTLLVATFETLDVIQDAHILDLPNDSLLAGSNVANRRSRPDMEAETDLFMNTVVAPMMAVINELPLELIAGLVSLIIERNDFMRVARSKPGIAFLTLFLSRAEILKNIPSPALGNSPPKSTTFPTEEALINWQTVFERLFNRLSQDFSSLFPSTRAILSLPFGTSSLVEHEILNHPNSRRFIRSGLDLEDEPVWQLMATLAVSTDSDGQQALVGGLRDKVLENVMAVGKNWVSDEIGSLKIRNVNLLLHALGLDASMINLS
ncbi:topoisomerase II-associated protein PAT1 [Melampsora americana]|nr:topoisomerase II-associated protein PAT1 [Melampsora americana]